MFLFLTLQMCNLLAITLGLNKYGVIGSITLKPFHGILFAFFLIFLNYQYLYKRHPIIAEKFVKESDSEKSKGYIILGIYVGLTIIMILLFINKW